MRKLLLLTLSCLFGFVLGVNAQDETEYTRKTWDFSKGLSDETIADLDADKTNWTIDATDANTGESTRWKDAKKLTGILTANGNVIKELDGISWGSAGLSSSNNILIFLNKIRVTRKNMEFTLKTKVKGGQTISITYQSANATATDRGVHCKTTGVTLIQGEEIALGNQAEGGQQGWGEPRVWKVDESVTEPMEVTFQMAPNGGIEIQSIIIDNGDEPEVQEAANVAFIYDSSVAGYDIDSDLLYIAATGGNANVTPIDVKDATMEALLGYEVVVVSNVVAPANAAVIKSAIAFVPMLMNGTALYSAWGYGTPASASGDALIIKNAEHGLFTNIDAEEPLNIAANISTVELGGYFANDDILATTSDGKVAIHQHNAKRNSYIMLPYETAAMEGADMDNLMLLVSNAIDVLRLTKKDVGTTATPTIALDYKDGMTVVTIKGSGTVYYTTDGSDPTLASAVYSEPMTFYSPVTVKAIAVADGYYVSKVATSEVVIKSQAAAPSISVAQNGEKAVVTINGAGTIYYNFSGQSTEAASAVYTEPFEIDRHVTVTAFATEEGKLNSEVAKVDVVIAGFKYNTELAHFDANKATYYDPYTEVYTEGLSNNKAMYYFGKSAQSCYTEEVIGTKEVEVKDEDGNVTGTETVNVYAIKEPTTIDFADGWTIGTSGQVVTWTSDAPSNAAVGDESNRYPGTVFDWGATITPNITFGGCTGGEENTAFIQTTNKLKAPFQIVAYVGNGHSSSQPSAELQVSADGNTWTKVADCNIWPVRRCYMRTAAVYEGTDEVYVRLRSTGKTSSAMVYDIYVNGLGDYDGIESVAADATAVKSNVVYNLAGQQVNASYKGIIIVNGKKYLNK